LHRAYLEINVAASNIRSCKRILLLLLPHPVQWFRQSCPHMFNWPEKVQFCCDVT
jgi:hypothetical protein